MSLFRRDASSWPELGTLYRRGASSWPEIGEVWRRTASDWTKVFGAEEAVAVEALVPVSDVTDTNFGDDVGGDSNGDLWDEIDDAPGSPDDGTTYITGPPKIDTGSSTGNYRVTLENTSENHNTDQAASIVVRARRTEGNSCEAGQATLDTVKLYQGSSEIDSTAVGQSFGLTFSTVTSSISLAGVTDFDDLRIQADWTVSGGECNGQFPTPSSTGLDVTQSFLTIG